MIEKNAIEKIIELAPANIKEIDNRSYSDKKLFVINRPVPETLTVHSMSALEDYVHSQLDRKKKYIVHINGPERIDIFSTLSVDYRQREKLISAKCIYDDFLFGEWFSVEEFIIKLQAMFVQDDVTAKILSLVGNITAEAKETTEDDGVTQRITAKAGLARVREREVPNPVFLRPFRTFTEIVQPASMFVLRISAKGPKCALFEADGGAWKINAIASISERLNQNLKDEISEELITILA